MITKENLLPGGERVAAVCPECSQHEMLTRQVNQESFADLQGTFVETVLFCHNCGKIVPHTCPPVTGCEACMCLEEEESDIPFPDDHPGSAAFALASQQLNEIENDTTPVNEVTITDWLGDEIKENLHKWFGRPMDEKLHDEVSESFKLTTMTTFEFTADNKKFEVTVAKKTNWFRVEFEWTGVKNFYVVKAETKEQAEDAVAAYVVAAFDDPTVTIESAKDELQTLPLEILENNVAFVGSDD